MVTLYDISGLPLTVDLELEQFAYDTQELDCASACNVSLEDIAPSLLNKSLRYPENVYTHHFRMLRKADNTYWPTTATYDVLFIPSGLLGIEFVKTHIFHVNAAFAPAACVVQVFQGKLTVLLQKNKIKTDPFDINTVVEEFLMLQVGAGEKCVVPAGYYYTFVNCEEKPLVFSRVIAQEHVIDYQMLRRENGLARYLISKNAAPQVVDNPRYRTVPDVKEVPRQLFNEKFSFQENSPLPLYEQVKQSVSMFDTLLKF